MRQRLTDRVDHSRPGSFPREARLLRLREECVHCREAPARVAHGRTDGTLAGVLSRLTSAGATTPWPGPPTAPEAFGTFALMKYRLPLRSGWLTVTIHVADSLGREASSRVRAVSGPAGPAAAGAAPA